MREAGRWQRQGDVRVGGGGDREDATEVGGERQREVGSGGDREDTTKQR
jgi:hypothetical protein